MQYSYVDGRKVLAFPKGKGVCNVCNSDTIAKCGEKIMWHWAHKSKMDCDSWWENETEWHRNWKEQFPEEFREIVHHCEVTGEKHRADIKSDMGYGFADNHINEAFSDYRDSRNRKVAIIDYACRNTTTAGSGFDTDHAPISKAIKIITTDIRDMECLGRKTPQTVEELKKKAEFEVSTNYSRPLSVWYGGVLDACSNVDKVLKQLI